MVCFRRFWSKNQPGLQEVIQSLQTLSALVGAGFPLAEALADCRDDASHPTLRHALERMLAGVKAGKSLSAAIAMEPCFPQLVSALIRSGESTGALSETIDYAATILELKHHGRQNLVSALAYPTIIMAVTLLAATFLATVIAPQVAEMYHRMDTDLPLLTRLVISSGYLFLGSLVSLAIFIPIAGSVGKRSRFISKLRIYIAQLPIVRTVNQTHGTALWCRCMSILLRRGISLPDALALTAEGAATPLISRELLTVRSGILSGESPGQAFRNMETCPSIAKRILSGGDRAGNLHDACLRVYRILDTDYRNRVQRMLALAEPAAVLIAGCFVILVALAVMLPVAELGGLIQ